MYANDRGESQEIVADKVNDELHRLRAERDAYREAFLACRAYHANNTGENALRLKNAVAAFPKKEK